jgi:hypothetical protein
MSRYLNEQSTPQYPHLALLASGLGVSIEWLAMGRGERRAA